jgi:hypothetical protein
MSGVRPSPQRRIYEQPAKAPLLPYLNSSQISYSILSTMGVEKSMPPRKSRTREEPEKILTIVKVR